MKLRLLLQYLIAVKCHGRTALLRSPSAQVVVLSSRCGEAGGDAVQLAVVRALLTVVTAEHFVVHGDCLMQARAQGCTSIWWPLQRMAALQCRLASYVNQNA